jgi:hypothetical protein
MGNKSSAPAHTNTTPTPSPAAAAAAKVIEPVCDTECQKQKKIQQTMAEWQKVSSDPTADPELRRKAYEAYMEALHGPAWKVQQEQAKQSKLLAEDKVETQRLERINKKVNELTTQLLQLEKESKMLDQQIEETNEATHRIEGEIRKGQQYARQLNRAIELRSGVQEPQRVPPGYVPGGGGASSSGSWWPGSSSGSGGCP